MGEFGVEGQYGMMTYILERFTLASILYTKNMLWGGKAGRCKTAK